MLERLRHLLEMIRFSHTLFAMPFALLAAVMAWSTATQTGIDISFRWQHLLGILLAMVFARSAAMAVNRIADRDIDGANPRTEKRHIPAGLLSVQSVTVFAVGCSLAFIASTLLFLPNWLPLALSVPVLGVLVGYSFTKRFTSLAHVWLGVALMLAPVSAWIAIRGEVLLVDPADMAPAIVLGVAVLLWVSGFDMIYACQDADFDKQARLHSIPVRWGVSGALRLAAGCHFAMIGVLVCLPLVGAWGWGPTLNLGWIYWSAVGAVAALLCYEHLLVRPDDLTRVNIAFFNVNAIVSFGLFLLGTLDLLT
jgi:4-hydroxybenzoate polyprenyltransferase